MNSRTHKRDKHLLLLLSLGGLFIVLIVTFLLIFLENRHVTEIRSERYLDASLSIDERVEDLLGQMTLKEKIGQMALVEKNSIKELSDVSAYGLGGLLSGAGAKPQNNTPRGWLEMVTAFTGESSRSRLQIPILYGVDANHGHGNVPGATIFPHFIGLGATGDEALVKRVARATADELQATGIHWSYSPTLDLPKDIRWGRVYETFSDDPELAGRLGTAYVQGLQGGTAPNIKVLATAKHYVGVGSMSWQSSTNKDFSVDQGQTPADEQMLRETYLPPFKSAINAGALSVMVGLNSWGEKKISANKHLITDILKNELGFKGFVVSDWYGVYEISPFNFYSAIIAVNAGVDMVMLPFDYKSFVRNVTWAVRLGFISEERIDDAVRRILRAKFALGLFDDKRAAALSDVGSAAHRQLAREAVSRSLVVLKNEDVLPIEGVQRVYISGSAADNIGRQTGAWTVEWQGIDGNDLPGATSILEGIEQVAGDEMEIAYAQDGIFPSGVVADVGIAVVGEKPYAEGWGDDPKPQLSDDDLLAIENLRATSKKVVVVLVTGRPLLITEELPKWDALMVAWLPGSEGAGVADVLFGRSSITGTLPIPWPASIEQLPIHSDGRTTDGTEVLFPRKFRANFSPFTIFD